MVSLFSNDFVGGEQVIQPDSFQNTSSLPRVMCMVNGSIRLFGEAVYIESRESEFDDEYDNGMELRDYSMVGLGKDNKAFNVIASILVATDYPRRNHIIVKYANWRIKASYPSVS